MRKQKVYCRVFKNVYMYIYIYIYIYIYVYVYIYGQICKHYVCPDASLH